MANIRQATLTLRVDSTRAYQDLRKFIGVTDLLHTSSTRATSTLGRLQSQLLRLVSAYAGLAVIRQSVRDFAEFERQLAMVHTMLYQGNSNILPQYAKQLRALSIAMGEDTAALAKGLYDVLSATIPAAEAMKLLETTSKAAVGGMTSTAKATDAVISVMKSYNLGTEYAAKVSSDLFEVVQRGEITFEELAHNIGHVAPIAAQAGVSLEELLAFIATTTRAGLRAELAVTAVKNAISEFIKPSREGALLAKELGFSLESATLKSMGLRGVFDLLKNESPEVLATLFADIRGVNAVMATLGQFEDFLYDFGHITKTSGAHLTAYNKMAETTTLKFQRFWMAVKALRVSLGGTLAPAITEVTDKITQWVQDDPDKFRRYGEVLRIEVGRWKDILIAFADYLRTDFSGATEAAMKVMAASLEAGGRIMIDLSMRIGRGIFEQLKENIFSGRESEIKQEAWKRYVAGDNPTVTRQYRQLPNSINGYSFQESRVEAALPEVLKNLEGEVRSEKYAEVSEGIMSGFTPTVQRILDDARRRAVNSPDRPASGAGSTSQFDSNLAGLERLFGVPASEPTPLDPHAMTPTEKFEGGIAAINARRDAERDTLSGKERFQQYLAFRKKVEDVLKTPANLTRQAIEYGENWVRERSETFGNRSVDGMTEEDIRRMRAKSQLQKEIDLHTESIRFETRALAMNRQEAEKATEVFRFRQRAKEEDIELSKEFTDQIREEMEIFQRAEKFARIGEEVGRGFTRGFSEAAMNARDLTDALKILEKAAVGVMERVMEIILWEPMAQNLSAAVTQMFTQYQTRPINVNAGGPHQFAHGGLFSSGRIIPFASGGVIDRPTMFPLSGGTGLVGENGPEWAIAPLKRMPSGNLGVETAGAKPSVKAEIHLHNESGVPLSGEMGETRFDGNRLLVGMILKDQRNNGPISRSNRRR